MLKFIAGLLMLTVFSYSAENANAQGGFDEQFERMNANIQKQKEKIEQAGAGLEGKFEEASQRIDAKYNAAKEEFEAKAKEKMAEFEQKHDEVKEQVEKSIKVVRKMAEQDLGSRFWDNNKNEILAGGGLLLISGLLSSVLSITWFVLIVVFIVWIGLKIYRKVLRDLAKAREEK